MINKYMKIAQARGLLDPRESEKLDWLTRGTEGEEEMLSLLQEFGSSDWLIYRNLWFENNGWSEADILVMSPHRWQLFEVKNYNASVQIVQGEVQVNRRGIARNPIHQVSKARQILLSLADDLSGRPEICATLVFINQFCHIDQLDYDGPIDIIARSQVRDYLFNLKREMVGTFNGRQLQEINDWLVNHRQENPFQEMSFSEERLSQIRCGVTCGKCHSFDVVRRKKTILCAECGHSEPLSLSLIRMIRDYAMLTKKEIISVRDVREFVGKFYTRKYIPNIMKEYLNKSPECKRGEYVNCYPRCKELLENKL